MNRHSLARKKGFTLIELLVVLFIIAIIITVAVLALGDLGKSRRTKYFAEQLKSTLMYAQEYAVIQPTTVVFQLTGNQFQFKTLRMIPHKNGSISYAWHLPRTLNGTKNTIPSFVSLAFKNKQQTSIQINSNATITAFALYISISGENKYYVLTGNVAGELILSEHSGDTP